MSVQSRRSERGYALIEAMVGGAVLMVALGSVLAGLGSAREHVTRSVVDQRITQQLMDQAERIRALSRNDEPWKTLGIDKDACLGKHTDPEKSTIPPEWKCHISVFEDTDTAVGGPVAGPLKYRRAVITLTFANRSQSVTVLK
jgi:uncharacterized membrane protein